MRDRLYRSTDERVVAGVCGGLAERYDLDPSIVRIAWLVVGLLTGVVPFLVLYVLVAIVVPEEPPGLLGSVPVNPPAGTPAAGAWEAAQAAERAARRSARSAERARRGDDRTVAMVVGVVLIAVGGAFLIERWFRIDWAVIWPAAIVVAGVLVIAGSARR